MMKNRKTMLGACVLVSAFAGMAHAQGNYVVDTDPTRGPDYAIAGSEPNPPLPPDANPYKYAENGGATVTAKTTASWPGGADVFIGRGASRFKYYKRVENPRDKYAYAQVTAWTYSGYVRVATTGGWAGSAFTIFSGPGSTDDDRVIITNHIGAAAPVTKSETRIAGEGVTPTEATFQISAHVVIASDCVADDTTAPGGSITAQSSPNTATIGSLELTAEQVPLPPPPPFPPPTITRAGTPPKRPLLAQSRPSAKIKRGKS